MKKFLLLLLTVSSVQFFGSTEQTKPQNTSSWMYLWQANTSKTSVKLHILLPDSLFARTQTASRCCLLFLVRLTSPIRLCIVPMNLRRHMWRDAIVIYAGQSPRSACRKIFHKNRRRTTGKKRDAVVVFCTVHQHPSKMLNGTRVRSVI